MAKHTLDRCALGAVVLAAIATAGCAPGTSGKGGSGTAADCVLLLRLGGTTFREIGFGEERDTGPALGAAEQSGCDDIGPEAQGAYFAKDAPVVQTWEVRGKDPSEVIATVGSDGGVAFYVADHLSDRRQEQLLASLTRAG